MPLTAAQQREIEALAVAGRSGPLNDLADKWGVSIREVVRAYADAQRVATGAPVPTPAAPAIALTDDQKRTVRRLAEAGNAARLIVLAEEWNVDPQVVNRCYSDCRAQLRRQQASPAHVGTQTIMPPAVVSPVADVHAKPGDVTVLPRNWPLIGARLSSGKTTREIAMAVGMRQSDYQRVEEGLQLPTADQAAKICALLGLAVENTFVVAAQEPLFTKGAARGLSLLGILRARARLSMKDLASTVTEATGVRISSILISSLERGQLRQPLAVDYPKQIDALATYFNVSSETIMAQVPSAWIQAAAANTAALHTALKSGLDELPSPYVDPLQLTGGAPNDGA